MATKTISIELDVYERLKRAKRSPRESFSSVLRRAHWPDETPTVSDVRERYRKHLAQGHGLFREEALDAAQEAPRRSPAKHRSDRDA